MQQLKIPEFLRPDYAIYSLKDWKDYGRDYEAYFEVRRHYYHNLDLDKMDLEMITAPSDKILEFIRALYSKDANLLKYVKAIRVYYFKHSSIVPGRGFIIGDKEFIKKFIKASSFKFDYNNGTVDGELVYDFN